MTHTGRRIYVVICWAIAGLLLLTGGILSLIYDDLLPIATYLGGIMLAVGGINIAIYCASKGRLHGDRWFLADGLATALLSAFPLLNQMIVSAMIPFFFGVWELFSGILKSMDSMELRRARIGGWIAVFSIGLFEILSGVAALLKPIEDFMGMHIVVAMILFVQSLGYVFKILLYSKLVLSKIDQKN